MVYVYMTAIPPNLISWTIVLLSHKLPGSNNGFKQTAISLDIYEVYKYLDRRICEWQVQFTSDQLMSIWYAYILGGL